MKYSAPGDLTPYTDRKLMRMDEQPLDIETIVAIQVLGCQGKRADEIVRALPDRDLTLAQVVRVLDPEANPKRRPERAGVGFAGAKARMRGGA